MHHTRRTQREKRQGQIPSVQSWYNVSCDVLSDMFFQIIWVHTSGGAARVCSFPHNRFFKSSQMSRSHDVIFEGKTSSINYIMVGYTAALSRMLIVP